MNKLLLKMERKMGKYAIRNLPMYIVVIYIVGYVISILQKMMALSVKIDILSYLSLNPHAILNGQVWRLFTWILMPASDLTAGGFINIFFTFVMLYFYYQLGTALENTWGVFRYNLYIFSGMFFTFVGAVMLYLVVSYIDPTGSPIYGYIIGNCFNITYINLSIFLAFAAVYPNMQVLLFFVIPVRIKWLALFSVILYVSEMIQQNLFVRVEIAMSLLNFLIFFFGTRDFRRFSPKEIFRKQQYRRATSGGGRAAGGNSSPFATTMRSQNSSITKHKCAICGRSERDGGDLEFRFCSKCNGGYEYCSEHLFSHEHVK